MRTIARLLGIFLAMTTLLAHSQESIAPNKDILVVSLPTLNSTDKDYQAQIKPVIEFLRQFWLDWQAYSGQKVEFVQTSPKDYQQVLESGAVDIIALNTYNQRNHESMAFSVPYAYYQQVIYQKQRPYNDRQAHFGIHSPSRSSALDQLNTHINIEYYETLKEMLADSDNLAGMYSVTPWALKRNIEKPQFADKFFINKTNAPKVYFHFAATKTKQYLIAQLNDFLRQISIAQESQWQKDYFDEQSPIKLMFGQYLTNLSQEEKKYLLENQVVYYNVFRGGYAPYQITDDFTYRGYSFDILEKVTEKTGVIFKPYYYDGIDDKLEKNLQESGHLALNAEKTTKREKHYRFSTPYTKVNFSLLKNTDNSLITTLEDIAKLRIAVVSKFESTHLLKQRFPNATFIEFSTSIDAIFAVAADNADVFVGHNLHIAYVLKHNEIINLSTIPLPNFNKDAHFHFVTSKNNPEIINIINRSMTSISAQKLEEIDLRWKAAVLGTEHGSEALTQKYTLYFQLGAGITLAIMLFALINQRRLSTQQQVNAKIENALNLAEQARADAEQSAKAKIDFLARMSHEIRTPMNGVLGMAEALEFTKLTPEQKDLLKTLNGSARNLMALLNDVLDFSKMDAGKLDLERLSTDLKTLVSNAVNGFSLGSRSTVIDMSFFIDPSIKNEYMVDPTRLTQVLNNLINNAIKFTETGFIEVNTRLLKSNAHQETKTDAIEFSVRDTGIGISPSQLETLFDPFLQGDTNITRKYGGTGLGLSICQEIVQSMGGQIQVESQENTGSLFYFTLVLERSCKIDENTVIEEEQVIDHHDFSELKVLFVEDNIVNQKVIKGQLARLGINADVANDGIQALDLARNVEYNVLLSDCHMPNMDGFELVKVLKNCERTAHIWTIAITADALSGASEKCLGAGFNDYLSKPCPSDILLDKLNTAKAQVAKVRPTQAMSQSCDCQYSPTQDLVGLEELFTDVATSTSDQAVANVIGISENELALIDELVTNSNVTEWAGADADYTELGEQAPVDKQDSDEDITFIAEKCPNFFKQPEKTTNYDSLQVIHKGELAPLAVETKLKLKPVKLRHALFAPSLLLDSNGHDIELSVDIVNIFVETSSKDLGELANAVETSNYDEITQLAHKLKGACRYLAQDKLDKLAENLEQSGREQDKTATQTYFRRFQFLVNRLIREAKQWRKNEMETLEA